MKKKPTQTKKAVPSVRLPKHVSPVHYDITLEPDLETFGFEGSETINLTLAKPVKEITLHSIDLEISAVSLSFGKKTLEVDAISYDEAAETATFFFAEKIPAGKAELSLSFSGVLSDNMRGFYKSTYKVNGEDRVMATTQFESTDARRAFPCFDEPAQKAVFEVRLAVPKGRTAISNTMPVSTVTDEDGTSIVSFSPTPKMSTYLLAFIVGDFEYIESKTKRGVAVRVYAIPGKQHMGQFALDCAVKTLDFYEDYFGIKYPLPVLDMIAIPDFAAGAMENWGAVTYREAILIDEATNSIPNKQWVAIVVAHELAHQWFGNLVTMEWWTDLWLNEGFASYIEYLAVDYMFPEWNMWAQFILQDHGPALRLDSLLTTHPIEVEVHHPSEIGEIFDEISYQKGAAVIRMLAEYIGPKHFRDGLRHYLKTHAYGNTVTVDLWKSFEHVSKKPIQKMMQGWTRMPGYPLVSASHDGKNLHLSQQRFFMSPISEKKVKDSNTWMVPVSFAAEKKTEPVFLSKREAKIPMKESWVKLNKGESGVFRVSYAPELLGRLCSEIANKTLSTADRLGVIRDLFALAEAGKHSASVPLDMLSFYAGESEFSVWGEILGGIGKIKQVFAGTSFEKSFDTYVLKMISPKTFELGWERKEGESNEDGMLRTALLYASGHYGDTFVVKEAKRRFAARNETPMYADLRVAVYRLVAENGGDKEYAEFVSMYKEATMSEEKNRIAIAMGFFKSKKLLAKNLAFAMSKDVRIQDTPRFFTWVLYNPQGSELAWEFIKKNWKELHTRYGSGGHMLPHVLAPLSVFTDKAYAKDIVAFFKKNPAPGAARTITQVEEKILLNDAWKKRDAKKIEKWLKEAK